MVKSLIFILVASGTVFSPLFLRGIFAIEYLTSNGSHLDFIRAQPGNSLNHQRGRVPIRMYSVRGWRGEGGGVVELATLLP